VEDRAGSVQRGQAVRSNATKSRATTLSTPIKSPPRRSLALAAVALACMLASGAEAAERSAPAGGRGRVISAGDSDQSRDDGAAAGRRIVHPSNIPLRHPKQRRQASNHVSDEVLTLLVPGVSEQTIAALGRRLRLSRAASLTADNITTFRWKILDRRPAPAVVRPNPSSWRPSPITLINWLARPVRRATAGPVAPGSA
jgi:hypothetical protein